jgi:hypothetical protein
MTSAKYEVYTILDDEFAGEAKTLKAAKDIADKEAVPCYIYKFINDLSNTVESYTPKI